MAETSPRPTSPVAAQSDLSTIPNTPRSPTPVPTRAISDEPADANSSPKSTTTASVVSHHDIQPTWPKLIDVTKVNALAAWSDRRLADLSLNLYWHLDSRKAFFKLRATIPLLGGAGGRDETTNFYIHVPPERIRQLSVHLDPAEKSVGAETLLLSFELNRPPVLVTPKTPCEPKDEKAKEAIDACRTLAAQTSFVIHANIPRKKLSVKLTRDLCAAATGAGLASLAVHASTARLYHGHGGYVVEGDTLAALAGDLRADIEPPPKYSEPPPAEVTPPASGHYKGKKRRRVDSDSQEPSEPHTPKAMQALLGSSLLSLKQHFDDQLASHFATQKKEIAKMLDKTEARILDTVRKDMDERYGEIQDDVLESVRGEIAEIEDNVMRNLTEAPMTATITFPQHPLY